MGRRSKGPPKQAQKYDVSLEEDDNQGEDGKSVKAERGSNIGSSQYADEEQEDYSAKQYPPTDEKYK